uniref:helix-turn-helix domain-containing protein n=1 Tax=Cloacibacillus evryensis TaxID=508460 RepID=UPI00241CE5D2
MWKIQKYRIARRLTQENLAEKVDLSVSYISEIENGKKRPSLKTLEKIAAALEEQGNLTDELSDRLQKAATLTELEDL